MTYGKGIKNTKQSTEEGFPFAKFIPSFITLLALCAGMTAYKYAKNGSFDKAILMLLVAAFLDMLDGRVARALNTTSEFGAELDSLCDLVNFGVIPALILDLWGFEEIKFFGWFTCLFIPVCGAIRLARFNVMLQEEDTIKVSLAKKFFTGTPITIGGLLVLLPVMIDIQMGWNYMSVKYAVFYTFFICLLMVSTVPTLSTKSLKVSKKNALFLFVAIVIFLISIINEPFVVMIISLISYLATIPFTISQYKKLSLQYHRQK